MPSNPFVALSATATLGASLLGISAILLGVDVAGTIALDASRSTSAAAHDAVAAALGPSLAPNPSQPVIHRRAPSVASPAQPPPRPAARRSVDRPIVAVIRRTSPRSETQHQNRARRAPVAVAKLAPEVRRATLVARVSVPVRSVPVTVVTRAVHGQAHQIASLRDVRRFVIRQLDAGQARECAISATAYTASDGRVIVDLVMRNRKARWTEKAVVRRDGTRLKLLGHKMHALPFVTLASADTKPSR